MVVAATLGAELVAAFQGLAPGYRAGGCHAAGIVADGAGKVPLAFLESLGLLCVYVVP